MYMYMYIVYTHVCTCVHVHLYIMHACIGLLVLLTCIFLGVGTDGIQGRGTLALHSGWHRERQSGGGGRGNDEGGREGEREMKGWRKRRRGKEREGEVRKEMRELTSTLQAVSSKPDLLFALHKGTEIKINNNYTCKPPHVQQLSHHLTSLNPHQCLSEECVVLHMRKHQRIMTKKSYNVNTCTV